MDQSPLPFAHGIQVQHMNRLKKRKKGNRNQRVWAAQPEQGDSKPFRTLNICFRPSGDQPGLAIIFRGKSLRLSAVENNWADTEFVVNWAEKTMKPAVADLSPFIYFYLFI